MLNVNEYLQLCLGVKEIAKPRQLNKAISKTRQLNPKVISGKQVIKPVLLKLIFHLGDWSSEPEETDDGMSPQGRSDRNCHLPR